MKYNWNEETGEKPVRSFSAFPVGLAVAAIIVVVVYLVVSSPGTP